jgi:tetratricopeptide (TPR) repeat protein
MQQNDNEEALRLLDGVIALAVGENEKRWVLTLSHHAANISNLLGDLSRVKQYYRKSLEFNSENPRALAGLADVAQEQGELELAKEYAARCSGGTSDRNTKPIQNGSNHHPFAPWADSEKAKPYRNTPIEAYTGKKGDDARLRSMRGDIV